jgi:hypothetical protein
MHSHAILPRHSFRMAIALGALVGGVFLGVGGRIAMRIFAMLVGRDPAWSFEGTLTVVFFGAVFGTIGGALLWLGRRVLPRSPLARGALFWIPMTLLYLRVLSPLNRESLIAFTPFVVLYGLVLYRIWCRRYVVRWLRTPAAAGA